MRTQGAKDFLFVKASRGGGGNSYWMKGSRDDHMYRHVVETVQQAIKALPPGVTFEIAALLYVQGESDSPDEAAASGERLRLLVDNLRQDLPNATQMKVIIGGIASNSPKSDIVRARQSELAKPGSSYRYVDTLDLRAAAPTNSGAFLGQRDWDRGESALTWRHSSHVVNRDEHAAARFSASVIPGRLS